MAEVTLREITKDNVTPICKLELADGQDEFVAHPAVTISQAHYFDERSVLKAIYADDDLVGLVALAEDEEGWWLWRLAIDKAHQRKGFGSEALRLIGDLARELGASELFAGYVPKDGNPRDFYLRNGWEETGRIEDEERVIRIAL